MEISKKGIDLIKEFEGCRLEAYQDAVGVWTIGYGHTHAVKAGDIITGEQADSFLREDAQVAEITVDGAVKVPLNQNQFDALVSFTFNLGVKNFVGSTLLEKLNEGDNQGAADEFLKWHNAGGKMLPGLLRRRAAERELFLSVTK